MQEMIVPGLLAMGIPVVVGIVLRAEAAGGLLMDGTITGVLVGLMMNNGGGAWDNAKKWIEAGHHRGKGSSIHAAAVVGDMVGDPFRALLEFA